jgi:hypothetical protein
MCCCVIGSLVNSFWKDYSAFILGVKQSKKSGWLYPEDEGTTIVWNTRHHSHTNAQTPADLNPHFVILLTVCSKPAQPLVWFVDHTYLITYLLTYLLTHSMEQSPPWEGNQFSASQEIPCIHKCPLHGVTTYKTICSLYFTICQKCRW